MPTHLKYPALDRLEINPENIWVILNPEYAGDDLRVAAALDNEDDCWQTERNHDQKPAHGFNGHDPLNEKWLAEDYYYTDEQQKIINQLREIDAMLEPAFEDSFEHLLFRLSHRASVRSMTSKDPRWEWSVRRSRRKRCKPSRRPYVWDPFKSA